MNARLPASACVRCESVWVPPRDACPRCGVPAAPADASAQGELVAFTIVHAPPHGHAPGYALGIVALADGGLATAWRAGGDRLQVGMRVSLALEPAPGGGPPSAGAGPDGGGPRLVFQPI